MHSTFQCCSQEQWEISMPSNVVISQEVTVHFRPLHLLEPIYYCSVFVACLTSFSWYLSYLCCFACISTLPLTLWICFGLHAFGFSVHKVSYDFMFYQIFKMFFNEVTGNGVLEYTILKGVFQQINRFNTGYSCHRTTFNVYAITW